MASRPFPLGREGCQQVMAKNDVNPWFLMWLSPKDTIKKIVQSNPRQGFFFLSAIWFLQFFFFYESLYKLIFPTHWAVIILIAIIVSPFIGAISFYVFGWFLYIAGKYLKGKATKSSLRCAFAWSRIPLVIDVLMWLSIVVFNAELIFSNATAISFVFTGLVALATSIWAFILLVSAIQVVQKFSLIKAIINVILAYLIVLIIFSLIISLNLFFYF